jgi:transcriptional regulator of acetoin/glycerol metabolism
MSTSDPMISTLVEDEAESGGPVVPRAWLIGIGSTEDGLRSAGKVVTPEPGVHVVRFGRDENADGISITEGPGRVEVGISLGWVSGRHAELEIVEDTASLRFAIKDLGSRNGTLVGGERITTSVKLRPGEVIEVGRSFWTVREVRFRRMRGHRLDELDPTGTCNPHLHHIHRTLHRLTRSSIPIVLRGETGTGKEYLARAIHRMSGRTGPFVVANLGAFPEDRIEAHLFGGGERPGLFEQANGGTLLLDELGELSPSVQYKLLLALSEGRAARVGEESARRFDVRMIASTQHDLQRMVEDGRFRPDLYSRLAGFVAELPPLRARREDIGLLVRAWIKQMEAEGRPVKVTTNAFRRMLRHTWPFNVRQLMQSLTTASLLASGDGTLTGDALAEVLEQDDGLPHSPDEVRTLRDELVRQLAQHAGDMDRVARALNRPANQVERWLERFALRPETYRA